MNTIRTFVRHVLEEHNVLNRLIMQEGGEGPDGQDLPAGLQQSLSSPSSLTQSGERIAFELDKDLQRKSAVRSAVLVGHKADIINNVNDMFKRLKNPGMIVTADDQFVRAIAILKLLYDDSQLYESDSELEFPYTTALFVIGWDNQKQSPADTLNQIAYNVVAIEESMLGEAKQTKADPRARGSRAQDDVINVADPNYESVKNALDVLIIGGGSLAGLKLMSVVIKHTAAEKLIKSAARLATNAVSPALVKANTTRTLKFMSDAKNAESFKAVYQKAIDAASGDAWRVWFRTFYKGIRDIDIGEINQKFDKRANIINSYEQAGKDLLVDTEATLTRRKIPTDQKKAVTVPITDLESIQDANMVGAQMRLNQILNFYTDDFVKKYEGDLVVSLMQKAASDPKFAEKTEAEMITFFIDEIRRNLSNTVRVTGNGNITDAKSFATLLSTTQREKQGAQGIIDYILGGTEIAKGYDFSDTARSNFLAIEKALGEYTTQLAEITAALFRPMMRSTPVFGSGGLPYFAGTVWGYTTYVIYAAAAAYLGWETVVGTDSKNTCVSSEDATLLLQDAHIRSSAKDAMNNIQGGGWYTTNDIADKELPLSDADNALAEIFSTPVGEDVPLSLINNAMILYREAIVDYQANYLGNTEKQGLGRLLDDVDVAIQGLIDKRKSKSERKPAP